MGIASKVPHDKAMSSEVRSFLDDLARTTDKAVLAPSDSSDFGVNSLLLLQNNSGGNITDGSTEDGANLNIAVADAAGVLSGVGTLTGTWKNVSGATVNNTAYGIFVRTV